MFCHPQGQRSPAAAEFEDRLTIAQFGALAGEGEHSRLGLADVGDAWVPIARGVFHVRTEAAFEKSRRQLVVLFIGFLGGDGDGHGFQLCDVRHELGLAVFWVEIFEWGDGAGEAVADAEADREVGEFA